MFLPCFISMKMNKFLRCLSICYNVYFKLILVTTCSEVYHLSELACRIDRSANAMASVLVY